MTRGLRRGVPRLLLGGGGGASSAEAGWTLLRFSSAKSFGSRKTACGKRRGRVGVVLSHVYGARPLAERVGTGQPAALAAVSVVSNASLSRGGNTPKELSEDFPVVPG